MSFIDVGSTNPEMIRLLADLSNPDIWPMFLEKYAPLIRNHCCQRRLSDDESMEIFQRVSLILVREFRNKRRRVRVSFRGYLSKIISHEISKYLLEKQRSEELIQTRRGTIALQVSARMDDLELVDQLFLQHLELLAVIQEQVRQRVEKLTWRIFIEISYRGQDYETVASRTGKSYMAVVQANRRVIDMMRQEALKHGHS